MVPLLLLVIATVGIVHAVQVHSRRVATIAGTDGTVRLAKPTSRVGGWSLLLLAATVGLWALTYTTVPIFFAGTLAGVSFALALVAVIRQHDRAPLLLIPLLFVPLVAAFSAAFVLLS